MAYRHCDEDATCSKFSFIICSELDYNFVFIANRFNKKCTLVHLGYTCHIVWYIWQTEFCFAGGVLCARWYCVHIDPVNSGDFRTAQLHSTTTVPVDQRWHSPTVPGTGGPVVYRRVRRETDLRGLWGGWTRAGLSPTDFNLLTRLLDAHHLRGCTVLKAFLFIPLFVLSFS